MSHTRASRDHFSSRLPFSFVVGVLLLTLSALSLPFALADGEDPPKLTALPPQTGVAMLIPTLSGEVAGTLILQQEGEALSIHGEVLGLTPGRHGIHIYQYGDMRDPQGKNTGERYRVGGRTWEFGNIEASAGGIAVVSLRLPGMTLDEVLGRSVVVHAGEDDLSTEPNGNAGPRIAVGVIGRAMP